MYKIKLALRYILKRPISWLAVAAVALCVFMVVVVMTVLSGLVTEFSEKNHAFIGDCVVGTKSLVGFSYYEEFIDRIRQDESVLAASPVITGWALISPTGSERNRAVQIMGIDLVNHCKVTSFGKSLYYHKNDCSNAFTPANDPNKSGMVLGIELISTRDMFGRYVHDPQPPTYELAVSCFPLTAKGALAKLSTDLVNTKVFYYSDDSHTGLADQDTDYVYLPIDEAQMLCGMSSEPKRASAILIRFKEGVDTEQGSRHIQKLWNDFVISKSGSPSSDLLKNVLVQSWKGYAKEIIAPLEKEQTMMTVLFALVGLITIFIIFVIFNMLVGSKTKDIGILKSFGADDTAIAQLFFIIAGCIGLFGSAVGSTLGLIFLKNINRIENYCINHFGLALWDRTMYAIDAIPSRLNPYLLAGIIVSAVAACLLGAILPALSASRKKPVDILYQRL